jgi:hypothetical protein
MITHASTPSPPLLLVIGPIASGKSTLARTLADRLREDGNATALVGLDEVADMARPTLPDWEDAHRIFGSVVGQWLRAHIDLVIAEGPCDRHEIATVLGNVPAGTPVTRIVVTTDFETALGRAQADPTRGLSQDPEFLRGQYVGWEQEFPHIRSILVPGHDLRIDTGATDVEAAVAQIQDTLAH